jgi:hypothetical protein
MGPDFFINTMAPVAIEFFLIRRQARLLFFRAKALY